MPRGGFRPGAGRPKKNKQDRTTEETHDENPSELSPVADTPLEYMLAVLRDPTASADRKDRLAIAAAPFMHPKKGESGKKEERASAAKKASSGRFAPAAPPKGK